MELRKPITKIMELIALLYNLAMKKYYIDKVTNIRMQQIISTFNKCMIKNLRALQTFENQHKLCFSCL